MNKKILAIILTLTALVTLFAACGKEKVTDGNVPSSTSANADEVSASSAEKGDGDKVASEAETATEKEISTTAETLPTVTTEAFNQYTMPFFGAFESETIDGEKVTDEIFKGNKITMVNVWGTFCSPCIAEMPDLAKISKDYESKGVKLIGIVIDTYDYSKKENSADKVKLAEDIISQTGVEYMNILPSASLNSARLNSIFSVPTTYFLNEDGIIIGSEYVGSRTYEQWCLVIDDVLTRA